MNVNIFAWLDILLFLTALPTSSCKSDEAGYDVSVRTDLNENPGGSFVIVSTMDGKVTALNEHTGDFAWSFDAQIGPLLSSSLTKLPITQNGKTTWLIPSLKGRLFKFDGSSVESLPITADSLLSSSFKVSDGSLLVGDHEVTTFGVDSKDGRLVYFCTSSGCDTLKHPNPDSNVIILKRYQKTVRSVNERNGYEKWNFSVGEFHLDVSAGASKDLLAVEKSSEKCRKSKYGCHRGPLDDGDDSDFLDDFPNYAKDHGKRDAHTGMQVSIPDGIISLKAMDHKNRWSYKFESPIASVWQISGTNHHKLDLFDPKTVPALRDESHALKIDPAIYLGMYDKSAYIQISNAIQHSTSNPTGVMSHLAKYSPAVRFTFHPYEATADRLTEATMTDYESQVSAPGSSGGNCENNWLSFMDASSKSLEDVGFFLKSQMPYYALPDQSERKGKVTEIVGILEDHDGASPIYFIYVYSISWWKQVIFFAVISVVLAFAMHIACQKYGKPQELKVENVEVALEPEPVKEIESKNSSLSESYESRFLHDFEAIRCLGRGGFGIVLESRNKVDDCSYAVKRIRLPNKESAREKMLREVRALAKLNHNCIVRYYNAWIEEPPSGWQEEIDLNLVSNVSMSSNPFAKSQSSQFSNPKPKYQTSEAFSVQATKDKSLRNRNVAFEPTEPFSFPSFPNGAGNAGFDFSREFSEIPVEESALSEESLNNQSLPFARYTPNDDKSLSIVFEDSNPGQSTSSRDSAIEEDVMPKHHHRLKSKAKLGHSNSSTTKKKREDEDSKILNRSTSQLQNVYLYIQMELCLKDSLQAWLNANSAREGKYCLWIMEQVLSAVEYIHDSNLIHRDLKPSNVFFSHDGKIKVGDFGLVTHIDDYDSDAAGDSPKEYDSEESHTERVGTRLYMAPEQMNSRNYNKKVDIFSTGIILIELFTTFSTHMERVDVLKKARKGTFDRKFSNSYKKESKLAKKMLSSDPQHRPTASEARMDEVFMQS